MITQIFKETDPVYVYPDGWGEVLEVENDLVKIDFGKRYAYHKSYEVSFTKYNLVKGGFSQERPKPKLEVGKSYRSTGGWIVINRKGDEDNYGFNPDGEFRENIVFSTHDYWQEISEVEAIERLQEECIRRYGYWWRYMKIKYCLDIPGHECKNSGDLDVIIRVNEIWNRNGCIFKDGKWAVKLEEPEKCNAYPREDGSKGAAVGSRRYEVHFDEIPEEGFHAIWDKIFGVDQVKVENPELKKGQMVWVKLCGWSWKYREFLDFDDGHIRTILGSDISVWDQYSILNPFPDSIEARAIDILRRIYDADEDSLEYRESIVSTQEFLKEIDSYEK